jgi:hypothetical protein
MENRFRNTLSQQQGTDERTENREWLQEAQRKPDEKCGEEQF